MLAASLARSAFRANAARAGPDHFVAAAMRTDNVHEHVAERFLHAIGVAAAVGRYLRRTIVSRMARDYIDQFLFSRARQIRDRTIERFLLHLENFL